MKDVLDFLGFLSILGLAWFVVDCMFGATSSHFERKRSAERIERLRAELRMANDRIIRLGVGIVAAHSTGSLPWCSECSRIARLRESDPALASHERQMHLLELMS
jgi:hypothetical protein